MLKCIILAYFSKKLASMRCIRGFGRKSKFLGNFEVILKISDKISIEKLKCFNFSVKGRVSYLYLIGGGLGEVPFRGLRRVDSRMGGRGCINSWFAFQFHPFSTPVFRLHPDCCLIFILVLFFFIS